MAWSFGAVYVAFDEEIGSLVAYPHGSLFSFSEGEVLNLLINFNSKNYTYSLSKYNRNKIL